VLELVAGLVGLIVLEPIEDEKEEKLVCPFEELRDPDGAADRRGVVVRAPGRLAWLAAKLFGQHGVSSRLGRPDLGPVGGVVVEGSRVPALLPGTRQTSEP